MVGSFFMALFNTAVDFRTRHSGPRGLRESHRLACGIFIKRFLPQDKEGSAAIHFRGVFACCSNQQLVYIKTS
jgi:hypothetical protein